MAPAQRFFKHAVALENVEFTQEWMHTLYSQEHVSHQSVQIGPGVCSLHLF